MSDLTTDRIDVDIESRLAVAGNPNQTEARRVLCVCTAGILRSPTTANLLHQHYGYNTRSAGANDDYALIRLEKVLLEWADEIVALDSGAMKGVAGKLLECGVDVSEKTLMCLHIPDRYNWNNTTLKDMILMAYAEVTSQLQEVSNGDRSRDQE